MTAVGDLGLVQRYQRYERRVVSMISAHPLWAFAAFMAIDCARAYMETCLPERSRGWLHVLLVLASLELVFAFNAWVVQQENRRRALAVGLAGTAVLVTTHTAVWDWATRVCSQ